MARSSASAPDGSDAAASKGSVRLARGVTATWYYTISALLFFELFIVATTVLFILSAGIRPSAAAVAISIGGFVWVVSTLALMIDYRHRTDTAGLVRWRRQLLPLLVAVAYAILAGTMSGLWTVAAVPALQSLLLLNWQPGVRMRAMLTATVVIIGLAVVDLRMFDDGAAAGLGPLAVFSATLPAVTVASLWWWDVLLRLDRARASESRLAATQERLRVATDVHDLQGHHLQVIALQLELAERLMAKDPDAALAQLRAARGSVAQAQQGTRDLALRFRTAALSDEIANAVDLLRAAGTSAEASVDAGADRAPASVLGPVIRETTTNVLRHGGGKWAQLSLTRNGESWRYEIVNDSAGDPASDDGSGLEGVGRRAAEAGGTLDVRRGKQEFAVVVTVPAGAPGEEAR
ncbi:sensor histidine kinase [Microbacterium profundi]|uniref:sensor histidine kinase n=1 Tax=Microbacterium profundi TaxID=450380 RepID=UPI001F426198|nr:histidine kinase [Microbacterium profundi]MCE7481510.1 histidine kinase [Microbacterium profundi]